MLHLQFFVHDASACTGEDENPAIWTIFTHSTAVARAPSELFHDRVPSATMFQTLGAYLFAYPNSRSDVLVLRTVEDLGRLGRVAYLCVF